jgi:hypothetical protein
VIILILHFEFNLPLDRGSRFLLFLLIFGLLIPLIDLPVFDIDSIDAIELINRIDIPPIDELMKDILLKLFILLEDPLDDLVDAVQIPDVVESSHHDLALLHQFTGMEVYKIEAGLVHEIIREFDHNLLYQSAVQSFERVRHFSIILSYIDILILMELMVEHQCLRLAVREEVVVFLELLRVDCLLVLYDVQVDLLDLQVVLLK